MDTRIVELPAVRLVGRATRVPLVHEGVNPAIAEHVASIRIEETVRLKALNDTEPSGVLAVSDDLTLTAPKARELDLSARGRDDPSPRRARHHRSARRHLGRLPLPKARTHPRSKSRGPQPPRNGSPRSRGGCGARPRSWRCSRSMRQPLPRPASSGCPSNPTSPCPTGAAGGGEPERHSCGGSAVVDSRGIAAFGLPLHVSDSAATREKTGDIPSNHNRSRPHPNLGTERVADSAIQHQVHTRCRARHAKATRSRPPQRCVCATREARWSRCRPPGKPSSSAARSTRCSSAVIAPVVRALSSSARRSYCTVRPSSAAAGTALTWTSGMLPNPSSSSRPRPRGWPRRRRARRHGASFEHSCARPSRPSPAGC